ncbi:MAG: PaaI family thioesterase [Alphaproteobacteria bacterium]|nr:PaaI family thioesterase [Alphaproteobacteria bacterium]
MNSPPIPGFEPIVPEGFNLTIGPLLARAGSKAGDADRFLIRLQPHQLNGASMAHGGFLMSIADTMMGYTVHEVIEGQKATTVSLNCDFVSGAPAGADVSGTVTITRRTRSLVFVTGLLHAGGKPVLSATGIWKILTPT